MLKLKKQNVEAEILNVIFSCCKSLHHLNPNPTKYDFRMFHIYLYFAFAVLRLEI